MILKQSTAVVLTFGPFVDKTDGVTLETGLVSALDHASTGIMLAKNGGTLTIRHATVTASTYDAHGCYKVTLDATDTGTLGQLRVIYTDAATCLPVWKDCLIVAAQVYDDTLNGAANGWTTAMTESYAADGATMTPAQALYMIKQMMQEMVISGTTMTVKKLDGTTTAMTLTLNDATNPTSITRAT
jgi:hypothetical protein